MSADIEAQARKLAERLVRAEGDTDTRGSLLVGRHCVLYHVAYDRLEREETAIRTAITNALLEHGRAVRLEALEEAAKAATPTGDAAPGCCENCAAKWWARHEAANDIRSLKDPSNG